jgi:hypothetical protein
MDIILIKFLQVWRNFFHYLCKLFSPANGHIYRYKICGYFLAQELGMERYISKRMEAPMEF